MGSIELRNLFLLFIILLTLPWNSWAGNIDPDNDGSQYAYGENVGWINFQPSQGPGVTVNDTSLSGYAWGENIGWINLGPAIGGVVNDGNGNLSGYAWGENVGWINFGPAQGGVFIDSCGDFNGEAWGENIGWISFRSDGPNPFWVRTSWIPPDVFPPVATASASGSQWSNTDMLVTISATDNPCGSGVSGVRYVVNGDPEEVVSGSSAALDITSEGIYVIGYRAADIAGNLSETRYLTVRIDKTAPAIVLSGPTDGGTYFINQQVIAEYSATDPLAGVLNVTGTVPSGSPVPTGAVGTYSFTVTATDQAGNTSTLLITYTVIYPGNIDPDSTGCQYAWAENVGWINFKPAWGPGVAVTDTAVTGMAWGENIGWINLSPTNGGVVNDGMGNLSGYAWGENVGWINFNPSGGGVSIGSDGKFSGYAWGENIGWINFSASDSCVKTAWAPAPPDTTPPSIVWTSLANGVAVNSLTMFSARIADNPGGYGVDLPGSAITVTRDLGTGPVILSPGVDWTRSDGADTMTLTIVAPQNGIYVFTVMPRDLSGNMGSTASYTIFSDDVAPSVALTAPTNGASVGSGSQTLSATASDNLAGIATVEFQIDGTTAATVTSAPYLTNYDFTPMSVGAHTITAIATDRAGNVTTSAPISVAVLPPEIDPDQFTFIDQTGVALNAVITSNAITLSGINAPAPISITGGQYSINGGVYTSASGTVSNGATVAINQPSSGSYSTTTNATLTIGGVSDTFSVTTLAADTTPDQFTFVAQTGVALNTLVTSNTITVTGINAPSAISINGGQYSINNGVYTSTTGTVNNGDGVRIQLTSSATYATTTNATLTIGGVSDTFSVTTLAADTTPNPFTFTPQTGVALNTVITSSSITVSGINAPSPISIADGTYSINGGAYTSSAGTANNGDTVTVRQTSSVSYLTTTTATLTIGGVNGAFSVTTLAASAAGIIDNHDANTSRTGTWYASDAPNPYGTDSVWSRNGSTFTWKFTPTVTGAYDLSMWWTQWPSRSTHIPVDIQYAGGTARVYINQQVNGGMWNLLARYNFHAGTTYSIKITAQPGPSSTCADAVKFTLNTQPPPVLIVDNRSANTSKTGTWYVSDAPNPYGPDSVWSRNGSTFTWKFTPTVTGVRSVSMWWTQWPSRSTHIPVDIQYAGGTARVYINQQVNGGMWNLLGSYNFNAGTTYSIKITSQPGPSSTCADAVKFIGP